MTIRLTADDERLIEKRLRSGAFHSAEEVIHDALALLEAEADWLTQHRDVLNEKIARGIEQLDRGEGVAGEVARARLQERKEEWLKGGKT